MSHSTILVLSDNRDNYGKYQAFANEGEYTLQIKEKKQSNLRTMIDYKFDLIIYEIMNPVLSEIEFFDRVHEIAQNIPIIIISRYFFDTKEIVFGKKVREFILKPFTLEQLILCAKQILAEGEIIPEKSVESRTQDILLETKKLSILIEISRTINSQSNFDDMLESIVNLASGALDAERSTLFIVDKERNELWSRTGTGIKQKEIRIPSNTGVAGYVVTTGYSQIIDDPYSHRLFNKEIDNLTGFKTRNILCVPMKNVHGEIIGVFQILNKRNGSFTKDDQEFLAAMAASTGIAIENAILQDKIKKQYEEVQKSYEELYISQNQMLKETRFSTISELIGFLKGEMYNEEMNLSAVEIKKKYPGDKNINDFADYVTGCYGDLLIRLDEYINEKKKEEWNQS